MLDALPRASASATHASQRPHDRAQDYSRHRMTAAYVAACQPRGPIVGDGFTFAVLRPHDLVDVVTDLVEQNVSKERRPQQADPQEERRRSNDDLVDEEFYPGRLSFPSLMVEPGRVDMPHFPAKPSCPLALAGTRQGAGVGQYDLAESNEVFCRNRSKQILYDPARVARRCIVPIGFYDVSHRESGYSGQAGKARRLTTRCS